MTVLFTFLQFGINAEAVDKKVTYAHNKYIVAKRIDSLNLSFRVKVTPVVQRKINNYISFGREKTNAILGTMAMYKPLFDKFIEEKNLQSIFGMLDPSSQGFINYSQYAESKNSILFVM
jgi:hypothetical protein